MLVAVQLPCIMWASPNSMTYRHRGHDFICTLRRIEDTCYIIYVCLIIIALNKYDIHSNQYWLTVKIATANVKVAIILYTNARTYVFYISYDRIKLWPCLLHFTIGTKTTAPVSGPDLWGGGGGRGREGGREGKTHA